VGGIDTGIPTYPPSVKHKVYRSGLDKRSLIFRLHELAQVENDRPMLRFMVSPFLATQGVQGPRPLYGSIRGNSFKLWENSWVWSGPAFTYLHGVLDPNDVEVRLLLRPRRSPVLRALSIAPVLVIAGFYWNLRYDFPGMTLLGQVSVPLVGLLIGLCFWLPVGLVHRRQSKDLTRYFIEELSLVEA
jgi:hypothetical protein